MPMTNRIILLITLVGISSAFLLGVVAGGLQIWPYGTLKYAHKQFISKEYGFYDKLHESQEYIGIGSLITIREQDDVVRKREELIDFIWSGNGFPRRFPDVIEDEISDQRYEGLPNLERIDRLTVLMGDGIDSICYVFWPENQNGKLMVYHQGHRGDFVLGKDVISDFLKEGYTVAAFSMPLLGMNSKPIIDIDGIGPIRFTNHNQLPFLETVRENPIRYFLEPVAVVLNFFSAEGFEDIYMIGISGGGWTTTIYSAIDPRIRGSFPVAGTLPFYLRSTSPHDRDWGDFEDTYAELYRVTNYLDMYILGSVGEGRFQMQVLNKYDNCCFAGVGYQTYENIVSERVGSLGEGGGFSVYLDDSHKSHKISKVALNKIFEMLG